MSWSVGRFLGNQLYGTNPYDPAVMLAAVMALGFSTFLASVVPAFRVSRISLSDALRTD